MLSKAVQVSTAATTTDTVKAAIIVVTTVPIACIYPLFQKDLVKEIQVGDVTRYTGDETDENKNCENH